jgi:hypothetical protein
MTRKRNIGSMAAIGGMSAAIVLLTGPLGARADELADLRANQELLQKRIDQLSQAYPGAVPGPYVPGFGPETKRQVEGSPVTAGSFPRSFLIPGTDTSLRIGGFANLQVQYYISGAAQGDQLDGAGGTNNHTFFDGPGGTGNLPGIPLNNQILHSRSSAFDMSPRASRLLFDSRTPTAWGEIKAYIEFDAAFNNTNTVDSNVTGVSSGWLMRLRKAYGTFGGLEAGQDTGILHDPDADPELVDQGGGATTNGRSRSPQIRYTYQGPYGTVWTIGGENPTPRLNGPFGQVDYDTGQIPNIAACSVTGNNTAALPATVACLPSTAFFSPLKSGMPEWLATARVNQPWGHIQLGATLRTDQLDDGQYLNQQFLGGGVTLSGDVHPFSGNPGPLGRDDLGFGAAGGNGMNGQIANGAGVATNFGAPILVPGVGWVNPLSGPNAQAQAITSAWNARDTSQGTIGCLTPNSGACINDINVRRAYDGLVRSQNASNIGGWVWYQHWWTDNMRSTIEASGIYNAINTSIVAPSISTTSSNNKILGMAHVNLYWSPVAFVDFGAEYAWGHRVNLANFKGDSNTILGQFRVRF